MTTQEATDDLAKYLYVHTPEVRLRIRATIEASQADLVKALEGVLHHNAATKPEYQLPQSLVRHVEQALAKARE